MVLAKGLCTSLSGCVPVEVMEVVAERKDPAGYVPPVLAAQHLK